MKLKRGMTVERLETLREASKHLQSDDDLKEISLELIREVDRLEKLAAWYQDGCAKMSDERETKWKPLLAAAKARVMGHMDGCNCCKLLREAIAACKEGR